MSVQILCGDVREMLKTLPSASTQCVVTSPPYFNLRSYLPADHPDKAKEIGSEQTPAEFVAALVSVFEDVRRVMRPDAVLFVNLGDSYVGSGKGPTGHNGIGDQAARQGFTGGRGKTSQVYRGSPDGRAAQKRVGGVEGVKPKNLLLIPQRFAIAMQDAGWIVRDEIVWAKAAPMPESVKDRCTKAWEPIYMFTKQGRYFWDQEAVRQPNTEATLARHSGPQERPTADAYRSGLHSLAPHRGSIGVNGGKADGSNIRNVWHLSPEPSREAHYAQFPSEIPRRCILAASRPGDTVLDPFLGSGTTALVADQLGRNAVGVELNPEYAEIARRRISNDAPMFADVQVSA